MLSRRSFLARGLASLAALAVAPFAQLVPKKPAALPPPLPTPPTPAGTGPVWIDGASFVGPTAFEQFVADDTGRWVAVSTNAKGEQTAGTNAGFYPRESCIVDERGDRDAET